MKKKFYKMRNDLIKKIVNSIKSNNFMGFCFDYEKIEKVVALNYNRILENLKEN